MNIGGVLYVLGRLCTLLACLLATPLVLCLQDGGLGTETANAFIVSAAVSLGIGWALRLSFEWEPQQFGFGEAFATVTFSWLVFTALGALPFLITNQIPSLLDYSASARTHILLQRHIAPTLAMQFPPQSCRSG